MKTIIFDIDNTLIDSKQKLEMDLVETFQRLGIKVSPNEISKDWYLQASSFGVSKEEFEKEFSKRKTWEQSLKEGELNLFPETRNSLEELNLKGHKLLALSKSIPEYTNLKLNYFGLTKYFKDIETISPKELNKSKGAMNLMERNYSTQDKSLYAIGDKLEDVEIIHPISNKYQLNSKGIYINRNSIFPQEIQNYKKAKSLEEVVKIVNGN